MRIDFQEITVKNFFSYGAKPTTLKLNDHPFTLITGTNGKGKSSLLVEAIFFALFGKPFKNIKLKSIINDINKKNCVVDLKFRINDKLDCRIVRGLSPDFIEFYKGDVQEDSRSSKKLMQSEIDDVIKLNADTLKNICVLAANESKSFLDMTASEARVVIENLFGLYVYSLMLQEVKQHRSELADKISIIDRDIELYSEIIDDYKRNFKKITELKKNFEIEKQMKLAELVVKKRTIFDKMELIKDSRAKKEVVDETILLLEHKLKEITDGISLFNSYITVTSGLVDAETEKLRLIEENTVCPVCSNELTGTHKESEVVKINTKIEEYNSRIDSYQEELRLKNIDKEGVTSNLSIVRKTQYDLMSKIVEYDKLSYELQSLVDESIRIEADTIDKHITAMVDLEKAKIYVEKFKILKKDQEDLKEDLLYHDVIKNILADDGVKSHIIKQDLPFLNTKVNEYLRKLGFNINLEFTDTFDLLITNPRKSGYSYNNFSNGQKKRIDLSILMAFIDLAKRKNSINTNLLIFDEIIDSSLDADGANEFIEILNKKIKESNLNVFIVSHKKDLVIESCRHIVVEQDGEFSYLT